MASERFEKLSKEKKDRILAAGRKEFVRVPYDKVSLNRIAKEAGISHGSFYTYFADKDDLMVYILRERREGFMEYLMQHAENSGYHWFSFLEDILYELTSQEFDEPVQEGWEILRQYMTLQQDQHPFPIPLENDEEDKIKDWIQTHIDLSDFNSRWTDSEIEAILRFSFVITMMVVLNIVTHDEKKQKKRDEYKLILHILKYGAKAYDPTLFSQATEVRTLNSQPSESAEVRTLNSQPSKSAEMRTLNPKPSESAQAIAN